MPEGVCVVAFPGIVRHITWNSVERRSVMASTADIQVNANRGRTTQELHREALSEGRGEGQEKENRRFRSENSSLLLLSHVGSVKRHTFAMRVNMLTKSCEMMCNHADSHNTDNCSQLHG